MYNTLRSFSTYVLGVSANVLLQFKQDKCLHQATSLAFNSLLSLIPLSAVALFLLKTFGVVENKDSPIITALNDFFPHYGAEEIVSGISDFANRNLTSLGVGGFLLFLIVSVILFMSIEEHFNAIWGSRQRLPFISAFQKYSVFCMLLLVGPITIFFIFSAADNRLLANFFPWFLIYCLFFFMYTALPNTRVKWRAALAGALIAGTLFQIARIFFSYYFELVYNNYSEIYGTFALLVLLAIWIYATWIVILLGVEMTHVTQYTDHQNGIYGKPINENNEYINVQGIITLFLVAATHFHEGKGACLSSDIAITAGVPETVVQTVFNRFKSSNLIYEVEGDTKGYLPACSLSEISLHSIVEAVDEELTKHFSQLLPTSPKLKEIFIELQTTQSETLKKTTVSSLLTCNID
ncbi:YihY family inner membrane protein [Candidatus Poribacteria bacterium]|nr:YihY family inner membrane protein [Candidatus Poribacteria bacterium]